MISVGQLDEAGIRVGFSSGGWTLNRGNLLLARGPKVHSLYPLYVTLREGDLFFGRHPCVILMARTTWTPQQGRHHAPIQSRIHPETLLFGPSLLRALLVWQAGSRITPDISTKRIEPARFGPLGHFYAGFFPEFSSPTPTNPRPTKKHRQLLIQPPGI